jgi:hypothetical protein
MGKEIFVAFLKLLVLHYSVGLIHIYVNSSLAVIVLVTDLGISIN